MALSLNTRNWYHRFQVWKLQRLYQGSLLGKALKVTVEEILVPRMQAAQAKRHTTAIRLRVHRINQGPRVVCPTEQQSSMDTTIMKALQGIMDFMGPCGSRELGR